MDLRVILRTDLRRLVGDGLRFSAVGAAGYVIDVGVFNLLRFGGVFDDAWPSSPVGAKVISVATATVATWVGNRLWTFRSRRRSDVWVELAEFTAVALGGMGIAVGCLAFSHYVMGWTSPLADNIAANGVGLLLATTFRFVMYRHWVFGEQRKGAARLAAVAEE